MRPPYFPNQSGIPWPTTTPSMKKCFERLYEDSSPPFIRERRTALQSGYNLLDRSISSKSSYRRSINCQWTKTPLSKGSSSTMSIGPLMPASLMAKGLTSCPNGFASWKQGKSCVMLQMPPRTPSPMFARYSLNPHSTTISPSPPCQTGSNASCMLIRDSGKRCIKKSQKSDHVYMHGC